MLFRFVALFVKFFSYKFEFVFSDEMLEAEGGGLAARVGALERRSLEQGEQLLCLRSSLADALRRLALMETARNGTHTPNTPTRCKFYDNYHIIYIYKTYTNTQRINCIFSATTPSQGKEFRNRQSSYRSPDSTSQQAREPTRRITVHGAPNNSALTQRFKIYLNLLLWNFINFVSKPSGFIFRRGVHYQSTGSLQSESPNSSSSLSPAPSPSPRATPQPQLSSHRYINHLKQEFISFNHYVTFNLICLKCCD